MPAPSLKIIALSSPYKTKFYTTCSYAVVLSMVLTGCFSPKDTPPPPKPPQMQSIAKSFENPQGKLTADVALELSNWLFEEGGIILISAGILLDQVLPSLVSTISSDSSSDMMNADESDEPTSSEDVSLPFNGKGWLKLTLPCTDDFSEDAPASPDEQISIKAIFSAAGLQPTLWGEASQCNWSNSGLTVSGTIAFFLPTYGPPFAPIEWSGPNAVWLTVDGDLTLDDGESTQSLSGSNQMMFSESESQILWTHTNVEFVIVIPRIDITEGFDLSTLSELSDIKVITGEGTWQCSFDELQCTNPEGEELSL